MHQNCINKFENVGFTEYECELRYMALGEFGTQHLVCIY